MWENHPEDILDLGHAVLYPLLPLTKGGATQKIITQMFDLLSERHDHDYAVIGYLFAARTFQLFKQYSDLEWLQGRFRHMQDFLRKSPAYKWILTEGREEGREESSGASPNATNRCGNRTGTLPYAGPTCRGSGGNYRQSATAGTSLCQTRRCPEC